MGILSHSRLNELQNDTGNENTQNEAKNIK